MSNKLALFSSFEAAAARVGVVRLLLKLPVLAPALPVGDEAYYPHLARPQSFQTSADEYRELPVSAAEAAAVKSLGDLPLIVLTAKGNHEPGWPEWQSELLELSSNSQHLFAENSGHVIQFDNPDAAIAAILQMVQHVRETGEQ